MYDVRTRRPQPGHLLPVTLSQFTQRNPELNDWYHSCSL